MAAEVHLLFVLLSLDGKGECRLPPGKFNQLLVECYRLKSALKHTMWLNRVVLHESIWLCHMLLALLHLAVFLFHAVCCFGNFLQFTVFYLADFKAVENLLATPQSARIFAAYVVVELREKNVLLMLSDETLSLLYSSIENKVCWCLSCSGPAKTWLGMHQIQDFHYRPNLE